jgi:asparagine synthase (glutamine-hydrolysing)
VSEEDFFDAIPEVVKAIESFDITTVRASVGNYLVSKVSQ